MHLIILLCTAYETNHSYYRRSTFGQEYVCRAIGACLVSRLALALSPCPVYIATSRIWDEDFRERVRRHQARRGPEWTNIEEEKCLSRHTVTDRVVLVDCVTLWCTNFFFDSDGDVDCALEAAKQELDVFIRQEATFIFVTNEIGLGGTSDNELQRKFTDLLGWMNQYIAASADEVVLMVAGIPLTIKK